MRHKHVFLLLLAFALIMGNSCRKSNGNPPLIITNTHEDIFYSRDTTDTKAYQLHVTYNNSNGSVDILRNEVGAVHASTPNEIVIAGIQTTASGNTAKAVLVSGTQYWLIPFQPGLAAISLPGADTAVYTCSCTGPIGGPCQLVAVTSPAQQPALITVNPHGCPSSLVTIATHNNTYSFLGGAVLLQATSVNIKK